MKPIALLLSAFTFSSMLPAQSLQEIADSRELQQILNQQAPTNVLKALELFENDQDNGVALEVTRDTLNLAQLYVVLDLFKSAQEENYLLRQENIDRLVLGSMFATSQSDSTYQRNGISFNKLRLVVDAGAPVADIREYFNNPMGSMVTGGREPTSDSDQNGPIEELEGMLVEGMGAFGQPRGLIYTIERPFGATIEDRLVGTTGLETPFNQYNFHYSISEVQGGEIEFFDPRTGEFALATDLGFYGEVKVNYQVKLFNKTSSTGTLTIKVEPPLKAVVDSYDLRAGRPVDILYVVDNSSGTEKFQSQVAESFTNFISEFGAFNQKIRVAAIATSSTNAWTGELLTLPGGENMLISSDPDFAEKVKTLVQPGAEQERRQSAILPTNNFFASEQRKEFLRDDAFFSIIIISEKDDDYLKTGDDETIMAIYRNTMRVIKDPGDLRVDAVVKYGSKTWLGPSRQGEVYAHLAREFGGRNINITEDFTGELIEIGKEISRRAQQAFPLSQRPYSTTATGIQVSIDENLIQRDPNNGWTYDPDNNRILLHGAALEDSFGKQVTIFYSQIDEDQVLAAQQS